MSERGFSLVEVVVAILMLAIGVIALAASAGAITRMTREGGNSGAAAGVASSRFESMRVAGCASLASGTATTGRFTESWSVTSVGTTLKTVVLTVSYQTGRRTRSATYTTQISCVSKVQ